VSDIERRLEQLERQVDRMGSINAIWQLQSLFMHHMFTFERAKAVALFSTSPECEIEISNKGALIGSDAASRYFFRGGACASGSWAPGVMILHESVNPVIAFDEEGERAKALWISPGLTTVPLDGVVTPHWNYGKFDMEYVREDGTWKILKFHWRHIFMAEYGKGWVEGAIPSTSIGRPWVPDRETSEGFYQPYDPAGHNSFGPVASPDYDR
jgi:hypothetical protein